MDDNQGHGRTTRNAAMYMCRYTDRDEKGRREQTVKRKGIGEDTGTLYHRIHT